MRTHKSNQLSYIFPLLGSIIVICFPTLVARDNYIHQLLHVQVPLVVYCGTFIIRYWYFHQFTMIFSLLSCTQHIFVRIYKWVSLSRIMALVRQLLRTFHQKKTKMCCDIIHFTTVINENEMKRELESHRTNS